MKYGVIGCGNMSKALVKALTQSTKEVLLSNRTRCKAEQLAKECGCKASENEQIARECERIFLGVKPHQMKEMLKEIAPILLERKPLLITMAAGMTMAQLEEFVGGKLPILRIMPNTPVSIGEGMVLYCKNESVDEAVCQDFLYDMQYAGLFDELPEALIDGASAISGCGPAFMYMFLEALADGGVRVGLSKEKALLYAAQTMRGAAALVLEGKHPSQLKDEVCSPGGSTICGVEALEENKLRYAAMQAVLAAYEKNMKLGK